MQTATVSAILDPTCRNSQKGIMELLVAVAADEERLQHCDINTFVVSENTVHDPTPTLHV